MNLAAFRRHSFLQCILQYYLSTRKAFCITVAVLNLHRKESFYPFVGSTFEIFLKAILLNLGLEILIQKVEWGWSLMHKRYQVLYKVKTWRRERE